MSPKKATEVDERIQAETPHRWHANAAQSAIVEGAGYMVWRVVFTAMLDSDDEGRFREIEVEAMGRTVEHILAVARRLPSIGEAVTFPWPIDVVVRSENG